MPVALDSLREWIVEISQAEDQDLIDPDLLPGIINGLEGSGTAAATDLHCEFVADSDSVSERHSNACAQR